jgi:erythronate-4-phosphate dehydrogenase
MKIIVDDKIPLIKGVFEPFVEVEYVSGNQIDSACAAEADALIVRTRTKCNKKLLSGTKVKFIATATIGFDHIDTEYCKEKGISWTNAPGCNSNSVKQWVLSALLSYANKKNIDLKSRTLGVIGVGHVGSKVVEVAEALGIRVLLNDPPRERKEGKCGFVSIETVLRECDIISMHVPLKTEGKDKTYHLVDETFLAKTNADTLILNSSRGEVIDTNAILSSINAGIIKDAILDVWENEPYINQELLNKTNIATPHIAGYSFEGKANGTTMAVRAVSNYFNLPLGDWTPSELQHKKEIFSLDAHGKSFQQLCFEAMLFTYQINKDDNNLRKNPSDFESLRGNYPIRHEPGYYQIDLINGNDDTKKRLREIGFYLN